MVAFQPRQWQTKAAEIVVANAQQGAFSNLVHACPGAGKTIGGMMIADRLMAKLQTNTLVVVTPNLAIKSQWIAKAKELFGVHLEEVKNVRKLLDDRLPFGVNGYIVSYQQAIKNPQELRRFTQRNKPIVILDEVHHTAGDSERREGNVWGVAVETAFRDARFVLCTTGTPFRQGNNPIAFVKYTDDGRASWSYSYALRDAIRDGVCRPTDFEAFDGEVRWTTRGGEHVRHTFEDHLTKKLQRERLEAALSLDGHFPSRMLEAANEKLDAIRCGEGADATAGGLVVAMDIAHAEAIGAALERISGEAPVIVHHKIDDAQDKVVGFTNGDKKWIIGISMLSEGVDIPRLRVGVYASRVRAPLYFHQFCGRFARVQESRRERAHIFMPRDTELEAIASEINDEKVHALGEEGELSTRSGHGNAGRRRSELTVRESDSEAVVNIFDGEKIDRAALDAMRDEIDRFRQQRVAYAYMTDAEVYCLLHAARRSEELA